MQWRHAVSQALTDFVSKWRTLFANVYVPCWSLASTSYIDVSNHQCHPMTDLHGTIFCPNKMLPRNSPVITLIYLLMSLYTSNIISILSLLMPSFKADAKIIIPPPNEVGGGGGVYWIHLVRLSVCRRHGFRSIGQVCFEFQFQIS